ncbi:Hypothetical predicted protein, partial [Podarcis lilfordi]
MPLLCEVNNKVSDWCGNSGTATAEECCPLLTDSSVIPRKSEAAGRAPPWSWRPGSGIAVQQWGKLAVQWRQCRFGIPASASGLLQPHCCPAAPLRCA